MKAACIFILLLAAAPAAAETLPQAITDTAANENMQYLDQQVRKAPTTAGNNTLSGANTFSGASTFSGAVTFTGTVSISTSINDGTELHYTSSGTVTGYDVCVASAVLTTDAVRVRITTSGCAMKHDGTNGYIVLDVLVDGARPGPYGGTYHMVGAGNVANVYFPMPIDYTTPALTAGAHTFCLAPGEEGAGTVTWDWFAAGLKGCYLRVKEDR